jgi:hypothetical protein
LKGLEISEVLFSKIDLGDRIDSEFFEKEDLRVEHVLKSKNSIELRKFGSFVASAFYPAATQLYEVGDTPFIRCVDCIKYPLITKEQDNSFEKLPLDFIKEQSGINTLKKEDIVITKVGTPSYPSMIYEHDFVALSRTVLGLKNIKNINKYYLLVFLRSKFGFSQLQRHRELTIQYQLTLERTKRTLVFVPSNDFQERIEKLVHIYIENFNKSKELYYKAESFLLKTIGLTGFIPSKSTFNIKSFKESFSLNNRLDAEYYQKKYEDYENLILSQKNTTISDEYIHVTTNSKKDKTGYNYIEIGDVNVSDGSNASNFILTKDLPANAKTLVKKGDILISKVRPYRGAVTIIDSECEDLIVSGAFTVLRKNPKSIFNNEVLKVLLRTSLYKDWLLKFNVGTSYPVIKDEDVLNMPIPYIAQEKQIQISELVSESFNLRNKSEKILEMANSAIEIAIEENEIKAIKFIENANTN